jgi:two-component system phosphate regulon sensor histidine kinase PhoR
LVGRPLDEVLGIPLWAEAEGPMAELRRTGRQIDPLERTLPGSTGLRDRDVLLGLAPLPDGYVISMADITRLKELDRLKTELVANVSHELRSPLTAIKAYAELLMEGLDDRDEDLRRQFLGVIDAEADRLSQCISNLLDLARIQAEGYELRPERFELTQMISDTVDVVGLRFSRHGIGITTEGPTDDIWMIGDRPILFSMLKNLVDNAAKFSGQGEEVLVKTTRGADGVHIAVHDSGPGIPDDQLHSIFERFYRVKSTSSSGIEGFGLGLVIARQAAQAHGGDITVRSRMGVGSTFTVHLPLSMVDDPVSIKQASPTTA